MDKIGLEAILDDRNFQDGLKRYTQGVSQMTKVTDNAAAAISGAFKVGTGVAIAGIAGLTAAMKIGLDTTLAWGEGLDKMGDMFGISGEKASGFQYLANKVGVSIDEMGVGLNTFTRGLDDMKNAQGGATMVTAKGADAIQSLRERLDDANTRLVRAKQNLAEAKKPTDSMRYAVQDAQKAVARLNADLGDATKLVPKAGDKLSPFAEALKKLGVRAYDAKGKLRTFDNLLPEVMDKFEKLPPGINASALAMDLFGARGGSKFLDFLRQGSKGLTDAQKKAKLLGLELSTDEVNAAEEFGFAMNELNLGLKGFWNQIGRQVLPIARRFVDFLNTKIIPAIAKLAGEWVPRIGKGLEYLADLIGDFASSGGDLDLLAYAFHEVFSIDVSGFVNSLRGVRSAIDEIIKGFQQGGFAGGLQALGTQLAQGFKNVDWTAVSKNLDSLKTQFWAWLTGKGGVLEQVGSQLGKVVMAIGGWLSNSSNTQPIVDAILGRDGLVAQFWTFITDPNAGLIATVASKMGELIQTIKNWSELPTTKNQFREIGKTIANTILEGIGNVFKNPGEGRNLLMDLRDTINDAYQNLKQTFANIGTDIAHGVVEGIVGWFGSSDAAARIASAFDPLFNAVFNILATPGGIIGILANRIVQAISTSLSQGLAAGIQSLNPLGGGTPAPSTPPDRPLPFGTGEKYANGGPVMRTGPALVHAGEYVLNRRQVAALAPMFTRPNVTNSISFTHNWNGAPASFDRSEVQRIAENAAYRGLSRVLPGR